MEKRYGECLICNFSPKMKMTVYMKEGSQIVVWLIRKNPMKRKATEEILSKERNNKVC